MSTRDTSFAEGKRLVLEAADIVRLIGETVQLKRAGRRYVGLCPFHSEKTPSFSVDSSRQFFYCFGCKKGGNAIDFVIERDRSDFKDALQTLAEWAGVQLPKYERNPEQADKRQRLLEAHSAAADIYRKLLRDPKVGKAALDYLGSRGFSDEIITRFGLGYAPYAWDTLAQRGLLKKFPAPLLEEGGLLKRRENGDGFYDTFRDRVLFPIRDEQGRVIAFGGRILPGGESPAKYLNSPETPLFSKSRVLFGLDLAKKRIVETRTAIVFEGYADAVMAHQFGVTNAVAVLGTSLTQDHAQALRRLADRIVLLFDADAAGGMAAKRSVELFLRESIDVDVAELPAGTDPDEFLQAQGREAFEARIDASIDALSFYWRLMQQRFSAGQSVTGHEKALKEYLATVTAARDAAGTIDPQRWGAILMRIQKNTGLRAADINQHVARTARPAGAKGQTESAPSRGDSRGFDSQKRSPWRRRADGSWRKQEPRYTGPRRRDLAVAESEPAGARAEAHLLGALFNEPHLWHDVQAHVSPDDFSDRRYRWLAELFWETLRNEGEPSFADWLDVLEAKSAGKAEAATRAKGACIELATQAEALAEALGDSKRVAAESIEFFRKRRGGQELDELMATARRGQEAPGSADRQKPEEEALLRRLEQNLRASGRA